MDESNSIVQSSSSPQCTNCRSAGATLWCETCANHYCPTCSSDIHKHRVFSDHHPVSMNKKPPDIVLCEKCSKRELEFHCHDCATVVCGHCLLSEHKDHNFVFINAATKDLVIQTVDDAQNTQSVLDRNLKHEFEQIKTIEKINKKKIQEAFAALHEILNDHEQTLQQQIEAIETKNKNLIESYQRQIFSREQDGV